MRAKRHLPKWAGKIFSALFWLWLWFFVYRIIGQELLLASPVRVVRQMGILIGTGAFWQNAGGSMLRTVCAYVLGVGTGILLAAVTSAIPLLDDLFRPALSVIRATPVTSFIILALVWMDKETVPVLTGFLMVLPIVWANVTEGIASTDTRLLEMAHIFRFGRRRTLQHVYIPSVLPTLIAACTTSIGLCWKATIAAEVLGVPHRAIGTQLYQAKIYLETDALLAWTLMVVVLSVGLEKLFVYAIRQIPGARGEKRICK